MQGRFDQSIIYSHKKFSKIKIDHKVIPILLIKIKHMEAGEMAQVVKYLQASTRT